MKYDGLRKIEATVRECPTVVYSIKKEKPKKPKGRRFLPAIFKQFVISALVVGGLLLLKYIDSGFSEEVFKGVKDIVSYNYEIEGVFS